MKAPTHGSAARKCKAHSSRTGKPCARWAIKGGRVCATHGGKAPQVKRGARERLAALAEPAVTRLAVLMRKGRPDAVALGAVKEVLGRALGPMAQRVEVSGRLSLSGLSRALASMGEQSAARLADLLAVDESELGPREAEELRRLRAAAGLDGDDDESED